MEHVLAVDLGGTNLRAAAVSRRGEILRLLQVRTPRDSGKAILETMTGLIRKLMQQCGEPAPRACGVGAPGPLNGRTGHVYQTPNLPWEEIPLSDVLQADLGLTVRVLNDGDAAALGELRFGAGRGQDSLIYLGMGTGLGGGIVHRGRLLMGADGIGAELGHVVLEPDGRSCGCGGRGCAEQYVSATGLLATYAERLRVAGRQDCPEERDARSVARRARDGDPEAVEAFLETGRYLGILLTDLAHLLNPPLVVLGGGVAASFDLLAEPALAELHRRAFQRQGERLRLVPASCGQHSGLLGAASWAWSAV